MIESHIAHMLRYRAEKYTDREVFRYKKNDCYASISWRTFKQQSEAIAKFLLSKNITTHDMVGIFSQNYPQWTICDLGILSTRAAVVPVYPTATFKQLEYIVNETEMQILFVGDNAQYEHAIKALDNTASLKLLVTFNCDASDDERVIRFEDIMAQSFNADLDNALQKQLSEASTDDLATIIYTSGTTGEPKGAMLNHSNFLASFRIHAIRLQVSETDVSMCFLPLCHIFERAWTFFLLYSGGVNVYNANPKAIMEELPKVKPTIMCAVPRFFEKIYDGIQNTAEEWPAIQRAIFNRALIVGLKYIEYQKDSKKAPIALRIQRNIADALVLKKVRKVFGGNIRFMPCSGSAMTTKLRRYFHAMGLFVNYGYGASETLATVSCMRHDLYDFDYSGSIMPEVKVKISDENMILVKGPTIFNGYYKKPEETAEVLKDGWYYTGDQGAIPEEGKLLMTERIKDIIKTSTGKYISPQKIELILSHCDLIEQLCVIGDNRKYLTALIVPAFDKLKKLMRQKGVDLSTYHALIKHPLVKELFEKNLAELQSDLPRHEKVAKFALLPEPFTIDNTMLTSSMKVRRKQVNKVYADEIAKLY
ncbi:long-chain fatty acid--CoA ligase [Marinilabiliaceae bacterium JC017]|nr:long-chain fatty acid--CoA ligase [Marinilabiliaceae bacterium JC017]